MITLRQARRFVVAVLGFSVLLVGVAMIVLPGPAFVVIPFGLGILATEFVWARILLRKIQSRLKVRPGAESERKTPPSPGPP